MPFSENYKVENSTNKPDTNSRECRMAFPHTVPRQGTPEMDSGPAAACDRGRGEGGAPVSGDPASFQGNGNAQARDGSGRRRTSRNCTL